MMAARRTGQEADAGFAIGVYDQSIIEENARENFGPRGSVPLEPVEVNGLVDEQGGITKKGWDLLNEDIGRIERNAMAWMRRTFPGAQDEGHDEHDLVGSFWFDPRDPKQAHLVDLAANTGRQERIDMVDSSYGDLASTAFDGISDFGASVLGGGITFFDVKPDDMETVEQTLEHERRRSKRSAHESPRRSRGGWWIHWSNKSENGPFNARSEAKYYADYWAAQPSHSSQPKLTFKIDQVPGWDERMGPRPANIAAASRRPHYAHARPTSRRPTPARRR